MLVLNVPGPKESVLLHSCCAPCSGAIIECMLQNGIRPTVFFSNSNIYSAEEYAHRKAELKRYCDEFELPVVDDDYNHEDWLGVSEGHETDPERGERCLLCFRYRLLRAAKYAAANGYKVLTTSLASSRWKDLNQVNAAGKWACEKAAKEGANPVIWWNQNWRKGGLQPRRSEIIKEQDFYNQTYCGCEFSLH